MCFFFFKQKTAYEMRISDWSSDVCSSDLTQAAEIYFHTGFPFDQVKLSSARRATISARATIDQAGSRKGAGEGEPSPGITGSIPSIGMFMLYRAPEASSGRAHRKTNAPTQRDRKNVVVGKESVSKSRDGG